MVQSVIQPLLIVVSYYSLWLLKRFHIAYNIEAYYPNIGGLISSGKIANNERDLQMIAINFGSQGFL